MGAIIGGAFGGFAGLVLLIAMMRWCASEAGSNLGKQPAFRTVEKSISRPAQTRERAQGSAPVSVPRPPVEPVWPTQPTGEIYSIEGPNHEVRLAYHQDVSRHLSQIDPAVHASELDHIDLSRHSNMEQEPSAQGNAEMVALRAEVIRLRMQIAQVISQSSATPPNASDTGLPEGGHSGSQVNVHPIQEHAFQCQLDTLRTEIERLRAENVALGVADSRTPPAYQERS
jgi:hypothetical protein